MSGSGRARMGAPVFPSIGLQEAKLPLYDPAAGE